MNSADILSLLEKPTRDPWPFIYQVRDDAAVSDIVAALRASSIPRIRRQLCYILNLRAGAAFFAGRSSETKQATPALIAALADADVREEAIDALGHIGDSAAGPALLELYLKASDDLGLRILLASALGSCQYGPALPALIEALSSSDSLLRRQATWGLRHLKSQVATAPLQQALLTEADPLTRQVMQETVQELEHPSTPEEKIDSLIAQIRSAETVDERAAVATALGDLLDQRSLAPLFALLHDEQGELRQSAALTLASLGEGRDADWFVRAHRDQVQAHLIQALADRDANVRVEAARALGSRWADKRSVAPLLTLIQDVHVEIRRETVATLSSLKDERTLEPLLKVFLTDQDLMVRAHAAQGLGLFADTRAVNTLIQTLQDEQSHIRQQAAELLCWLQDERATAALLQALQDIDPEVREWAIEALWQLCVGKGNALSAEAIQKMHKPLLQALQDDNSEVRACVEKILAWLD